jgi:hypothetical protein
MKPVQLLRPGTLTMVFWLCFVALLANGLRVMLTTAKIHASGHASRGTIHPYTSILKETVYDPRGHAMPGGTYTWSVRADGSRAVRLEDRPGSTTVQRKIDFATGDRVSLVEASRLKSTMVRVNTDPAEWIRDPESKCLDSINGQKMTPGEELSGNENIDGYRTAKVMNNTMTFWYSVDYGCALVKSEATWQDGSRTVQELATLLPGEPSPALFTVPADYSEVPPSKMLPGPITPDAAQRMDKKYYEHQAH